MAIEIYVNGRKEEIINPLTIQGLLEVKKISPEVVTLELNEEIILKDKYQTTVLKPKDKLEFVYYMGGGGSTHFVRSPFISETNHPERVRSVATNESKDKGII